MGVYGGSGIVIATVGEARQEGRGRDRGRRSASRRSAEHQFELDHRHRFLDSFLRVIVYSMHSVGAEGVVCVGRMNENEIR